MKMEKFPRARGIVAVRADGSDLPGQLAALNTALTEFQTRQETRLAALEAGRADDVVDRETLNRINGEISALTTAVNESKAAIDAARIGGAGNSLSAEAQEHRTAFNALLRRGIEPDAGMRSLEVRAALTTDSDPDGGFLVPAPVVEGIDRVLGVVSAMRTAARVINVGGGGYKKAVNLGGATSGWVGEKSARPETGTPDLSEIGVPNGELYANPAATQRMLDDSIFDVEAWLAEEIAIEFAEEEGAAFITGNGVNKPRGILAYDKVANASYSWGKTGFVVSGKADGFLVPTSTASPADALVNLYHSLRSGYRAGAAWMMNDLTVATIRQFKDGDGKWLWQPPTAEAPELVLGKPCYTDDNMPTVAADAFAVAFANFMRAYTITDGVGVRILRDPFTNKPFVHFYATRRVGGGITNFEAIKLLKIST